MRTFGNELISSELVAIIELVKNAYDADATRVLINFTEPLTINQGRIEVLDDGHGMSLQTILSAWMEPATSFKKKETRSPRFKRRVTGEKGIGRFAASKLADTLEVISRCPGSDEESRVIFDWRQYDDETKYLHEIEALWETSTPNDIKPGGVSNLLWMNEETVPLDAGTQGTMLRMERLRNVWNRDKLEDLRIGLSRLVPPKLKLSVPVEDVFHIVLRMPEEFSDISGIVGPSEVFQKPPYELSGEISEDGDYSFHLSFPGIEEDIKGRFTLDKNHLPVCGPLRLELRVWDRDATGLAELVRSFGSTQKNIRDAPDKVAGVQLFRDGFRIFPYGDAGNDWLELDKRRVNNPTLRLSNNQVVGFVLITADKNSQLRDQSNREGLMESQATDDLRQLMRATINEIEQRRWAIRHPPETEDQRKSKGGLFTDFNLDALGRAIKKTHAGDTALIALIDQANTELKSKVEEVQQVLARYHRLATLGTLVDTFLHDGRAPLGKIKNEAFLINREIAKPKADPATVIEKIRRSVQLIGTQAEAISTVFTRLEPFAGRRRGRPAKVRLEDIIRDAFAVLETIISELAVQTTLPSTNTEVTVDPPELQEVIIILLDNSLHWLRTMPVGDRRIHVDVVRRSTSSIEITFSDNGPGVPDAVRDAIFQPYFSTKPDGIGLGLAIAGEIVKDYYDGDLELLHAGPLPGATFRVTLNKRV
eukprot:TRINITY_DN277_c0_g1_i3.p1 TRINITY_DN277_c0_g1~~TRINITY_DN277_c0_g1_i3.p1  ORF type:complete len:707 (+),score=112.97 TRINITY_DN277_c0_g1_i3:2219-4339(+)